MNYLIFGYLQFIFMRTLLHTVSDKEQTSQQHVFFQYDFVENEKIGEVVDAFLEHWKLMIHLNMAVVEFANYMLSRCCYLLSQ